jgi:hypothetical protein
MLGYDDYEDCAGMDGMRDGVCGGMKEGGKGVQEGDMRDGSADESGRRICSRRRGGGEEGEGDFKVRWEIMQTKK